MSSWFNYRFHDEEGNVVFLRGKKTSMNILLPGKYSQRLEIAYHFRGNDKTNLPDETMLGKLIILSINLKKGICERGKTILTPILYR